MKNNLFAAIEKSLACKDELGADVMNACASVSSVVGTYLNANSICAPANKYGVLVSNESFDSAGYSQLDADKIIKMVQDSKVPTEFQAIAAKEIATLLQNAANGSKSFNDAMMIVNNRAEQNGSQDTNFESLYPEFSGVMASANSVSTEAFGAEANTSIVDLQAAITVSLMKWHNTITPRVLQSRTATSPMVTYVREEVKVYNLESKTVEDVSIVDLYRDPSMIENELVRIKPLIANDTDSVLVADDVIKFGKEASLLALGITSEKYGHAKINRTDLVADGAVLESVTLQLNNTAGDSKDTFTIPVPAEVARLTRAHNQVATVRAGQIRFTTVLDATSTMTNGTVSPNIADIVGATEDKIVITFDIAVRLDIREGATHAMQSATVTAVSSENGEPATATKNALDTAIANGKFDFVGYTMDAKYSEENNRKSNIAMTTERKTFSFELSQGRNFVIDCPHQQNTANRSADVANLHNVIRLGQDVVTIKFIKRVLEEISAAEVAYAAKKTPETRPGARYAAGGRVIPTFVQDTLDMTGVDSFDDSKRQDAIEGRFCTFMTSITTEIMTKSFFAQQLVSGTNPVFRLLTSGRILDNIVGAKPGTYGQTADAGVELAIKLSNGIVLECITTTFDMIGSSMILVPHVSGSETDLNFGASYNYGTVVGSYSYNDGNNAAVHRMIASVRENPIPTNAIGAIIDVKGVEFACFRTV